MKYNNKNTIPRTSNQCPGFPALHILRRAHQALRSVAHDRKGNFAVLTALVLPVLFAAAGVAIDYTDLLLARTELQGYADSAALAAVSALVEKDISLDAAKALVTQFFVANYSANHHAAAPKLNIAITVATGVASKTFTAEATVTETVQLSPFSRFLGQEVANVSALGRTTSSRGVTNALSMFLVLDRSLSMKAATTSVKSQRTPCDYYHMDDVTGIEYKGSMTPCYYSRMESLKSAVDSLLDMLDGADPTSKVIRVGAIAYNQTTLPEQALEWGVDGGRKYAHDLSPDGGTNSSTALAAAVKLMSDSMEVTRQHNRNGLPLRKAIVFLTDGVNNQTSYDTDTLRSCSQAKADGITIYTVAFTAGERGRRLLSACATSDETSFYAADLSQLNNAFQDIGSSFLKQTARLTH
ncbi:MAG: VWA domain-containing protein [Rhizobium sp.]